MKIKKYGYSEFKESSELKFAVVVPIIDEEKKVTVWKFVTSIDWLSKEWKAENNKGAHLFKSRKDAQDFVLTMIRAWTGCFVVEVLEGFVPTNNW
jgi:hypothetical protein